MNKVIFTIVAKNYFASAELLAKSLMNTNCGYDFYIVLADEVCEEISNRNHIGYKLLIANELPIKDFQEMAFKYDVTEFATSIKPYCIEYFMKSLNAQSVAYLDPDIYVYKSLDYLFDLLNEYSAIVTPHILTSNNSSHDIEQSFLFSGTYNLGFFAVSNNDEGRRIVNWWKNKLKDYAFVDYYNGLYTDQKWMNLVTTEFENVCVLRDFGYNVAWWNFEERNLSQVDGIPFVCQNGIVKPVVFFHFSGFKADNMNTISKSNSYIQLDNKDEIRKVFDLYGSRLLQNDYNKLKSLTYSYSTYDNGIVITRFQRRLFRAMNAKEKKFIYPFSTLEGSFYDLLKKNKLLVNSKDISVASETRNTISGFNRKDKILKKLLRMTKKVLGIKHYEVLIRYLSHALEAEEQIFLITKGEK